MISNEITIKQQNYIDVITDKLGIEFTGKTKAEAREFISKNIDEYRQVVYIECAQAELDFFEGGEAPIC